VPGFALKALYGQMAFIVTTGQPVTPAALTQLGYQFRYPELAAALAAALN
jgi:NAD dependent epimerase/dehydratase family enzyme